MPLNAPELLRAALARPIAIFGGGVSGSGVRALVEALGGEWRLYDANTVKGADFTTGVAKQHALVVFSPGFTPEHPWLARAKAAGASCLNELDFGALCWRGRIVAVTGTNGKTTLTEFLAHALRATGRAAHATGNIGYPLSQLAADKLGGAREEIAVCEVSSFQAETLLHFRADATLWTNFAEDHLERHASLESYFGAKWNLIAHTTSRAVFLGASVERHARKFERALTGTLVVPTERQPPDERLAGTVFADYPQRENFLLAAAWWRANGFDEATLLHAARSFQLGRHRMTRVAELDGVTFWNDSKATNFHATEAALARFSSPPVLIAGGKPKGGDLAGFVHRAAPHVKHLVLIGETSGELAFHASVARVAHTRCASLEEATRRAAELAAPGEHVLLSPGFASFDMFRSYEDRGNQFEHHVHNLAAPAASLG